MISLFYNYSVRVDIIDDVIKADFSGTQNSYCFFII